LETMKRDDDDDTYSRWMNQYTTIKPWKKNLESKEEIENHQQVTQNGHSFKPLTNGISPPKYTVTHVERDHHSAKKEAMERLYEERRQMQQEIVNTISRNNGSSYLDLTDDTVEYSYNNSLGKSFYNEDKLYNKSRAELHSILTNDPSVEFKRRIAQEEQEKIFEEAEKMRQKLRMLSEAYQKDNQRMTEEHKKRLEKLRDKDNFPPLSEEEEEKVQEALSEEGSGEDILSECFNLQIKKDDIWRLRDCEWLNDEVINFYMEVLLDRCKKSPAKLPKCHFFNSFFYPLLAKDGYSRVRKWSRKVDIFEMDKVVVPVHMGNHWCLAVVNFREKRFEYYDSLGGSNSTCLKALRQYVKEEHKDKKKKEIDLSDWTDYTPSDIPHQRNGYDCGVFMCKYADYVSKNQGFTFGQNQMQYFRKRLVLDILNKNYSV